MKSICVAEIQYADNDNITENENIYLKLTFELITHFLRRLECRRCDTVSCDTYAAKYIHFDACSADEGMNIFSAKVLCRSTVQ